MKWTWWLFICLKSSFLLGGELEWIESAGQNAIIAIKSETSKYPTQLQENLWQNICESLGQRLKKSNSGQGFLTTFKCAFGKNLTELEKNSGWIIFIHETKEFLAIDIYSQRSKEFLLVQNFSFTSRSNKLELYERPKVLENLARLIIESIPTGWNAKYQGVDKNFAFESSADLPALPTRLLVYRLAFDLQTEQWLSQPRAELEYVQTNEGAPGKKIEIFRPSRIWIPLVQGENYWVQNSNGLNLRQSLYEKRLAMDLEGFSVLGLVDRLFLESLTSNYFGLRYGRSFLKGRSVITETPLISLLVEMRSGLFAGLRWYYDYMPKVKASSDFGQEHFAMKRLLLGWAFDYKAPKSFSKFVSRVDLQPKLGLLDVEAQFLVADSNGVLSPFELKAKNIANLSLELGIERESWLTRNRLWVSYSSAKIAVKNSAGLGISSSRIGLDIYIDLSTRRRLKWSALAFGMAENMELTRDNRTLLRKSDSAISEISFNLFFLGGGLSLSW